MKHLMRTAALLGTLSLSTAALAEDPQNTRGEIMFDTDTQTYLTDTDADSFPDKTEKIAGTDYLDASDFPGKELQKTDEDSTDSTKSAGFPSVICRWGFRTVNNLCIDFDVQNATRYDRAAQRCRSRRARVATYEDLAYLYLTSGFDASYNPNGRWIGNMTGNNTVMRGNSTISFNNDPDIFNFESTTDKGNNRSYWCAHDRG